MITDEIEVEIEIESTRGLIGRGEGGGSHRSGGSGV